MAMDAAPALKRKDADPPELWLDDGGAAASGFPVSSRATKIRRLDAEVPPIVPGVSPPPTQQQQPVSGLGAGEVRMFGDQVPLGMAAAAAAKRKGEDAPELWLDDGGAASGFPVSSRATKIRRLDAEVPPVVPELCAPPPPQQQQSVTEVQMCGGEVPVIAVPAPNEEKAIVLYKPDDAARNLLLGPLRPEFPLRVSPDWIHGLKSTALREASEYRALFEELARDETSNLAMVPWVPVPSNSQEASTTSAAPPTTEMVDAEDTSMEVEQDGGSGSHLATTTGGVAQGGEPLPYHQWPPPPQQQQHCIVPQQRPLPAASYQPSPVTWSW